MSKNAQHQWEVVPGPDNLVRCKKCGSEVKASRARRGVGPCIWGDSGALITGGSIPSIHTVSKEKPGDAAKAAEQSAQEELEEHARKMRELNLCDTCLKDIAHCISNPSFGTGKGNDNVYACDAFNPGEEFSATGPQELIAAAVKANEQFTQEELEEAAALLRASKEEVTPLPEGVKPVIFPGPRLTDPPEICNGCGERLAILPLNSRLDMVACNNGHCALYRERLRMVTKPTKRGKRKRAKG